MKTKIISSLAVCIMLLTGCVPYHQLGERLIIQAVGLDFENDVFIVTAKYLGGENPDGKKNKPEDSLFIAEGRGSSVSHALQEAGVNAGKPLILTDCQIFIIGSSLRNRSLTEILSVLLNEYEGYPNITLATTDGTAAELILMMYRDESFSENKYHRIISESRMLGFTPPSDLYTVIRNLSNGLECAYLPVLTKVSANSVFTEDGDYVTVNGGAVYKDAAYMGNVDAEVSAGVAFMLNAEISTSITVIYKDRPTLVNINNIKIRTKPEYSNGVLRYNVSYNVSASYSESRINFDTEEIERAIEDAMNVRILNALEKTARLGIDIVGLEETIRSKCFNGWKAISPNWENEIKNIEFTADGSVYINKYGIRW